MNLDKIFFRNYLKYLGIHFAPRTFIESVYSFEKSKPLLLIGLPRSGTSIAQVVFNHFQEVFVAYESIIEPYIFEKNKYKTAAFFYEVLRQYDYLNQLNEKNSSDYMYKKPLYAQNYKYLGNKSIFSSSKAYRNSLKEIIYKNKELKVIFIQRDPRDRLLSVIKWRKKRDKIFKNTIEKEKNELVEIARIENNRSNEFSNFISDNDGRSNVFTINYEDFVSNKQSINLISDFLEIDDIEPVVKFYNRRVSKLSIGNWKEGMEVSIKELVESTCSKMLSKYYP